MKTLSIGLLLASCATHADVFQQWDSLFEDASFGPGIWDGRNGLAEYRRYEEGNLVARSWYLVELDEQGAVTWMISTSRDERGRYALETAAGADMATTLVGAARGLSEANPLGIAGVAVAKGVGVAAMKSVPASVCYETVSVPTTLWSGAAGWNVGMLAGIGPAAIIPAVAAAFISTPDHNDRFWACAPRP